MKGKEKQRQALVEMNLSLVSLLRYVLTRGNLG